MNLLRFTITVVILVVILLGGDYLQYRKLSKFRKIVVSIDALTHGVIAVIIVLPLLEITVINEILIAMVAFFIAGLLDIDHFVVAKSIHISDAIKLNSRPYTHSITFALILALLVWGISQRVLLGVVAFIAVTSHVVRDASGGITPLLWPLPTRKIPYWSYLIIEVSLLIFLQAWVYSLVG